MTEGTRLSLVTGRPNEVGSARVYLLHQKSHGIMVHVRLNDNEGYREFLPFDGMVDLGDHVWKVTHSQEEAPPLDAPPGTPWILVHLEEVSVEEAVRFWRSQAEDASSAEQDGKGSGTARD